jgi:diaminohydroxyphosphoribosylaminopyrimidine deaminase / 5-amino-6-(5-phosphoribosylamino)uracil reductase
LSTSINARFMAAALALSSRARARSTPNPNVGCIIEKGGRVIGRGWTQPGGRPHAEAMALAEAGDSAGTTAWVTLEPCAHESVRGPACADSLIEAGVARVIIAMADPDPRTNGAGIMRLKAAGVEVVILDHAKGYARREMAGWWSHQTFGRPHVTLKLATSLDGCIALKSGESKWITGDAARAHAHLERARSNMVLVGRGTFDADAPALDVRLPGLEERSPRRGILTNGDAPEGWESVACPEAIRNLEGVDWLLLEGGAQAAAAFLKEELVDRLLLYRAPITIGAGHASLGDIGLNVLGDAHGVWHQIDKRQLGCDTLDVYERAQKEG